MCLFYQYLNQSGEGGGNVTPVQIFHDWKCVFDFSFGVVAVLFYSISILVCG